MSEPIVNVPISSDIYAEFLFRKMDKNQDVGSWMEQVLQDYLDRTEDEGDWAEEYYSWKEKTRPNQEFISKYGDPEKGYYWLPIYLPNGTQISMTYKGSKEYACVSHEKIIYKDKEYSPATLARKIAGNTSRNAWRDLYIKRPTDSAWIFADNLRRGKSV